MPAWLEEVSVGVEEMRVLLTEENRPNGELSNVRVPVLTCRENVSAMN